MAAVFLLLGALGWVALAATPPAPPPPAALDDASPSSREIVLVLDDSGSMQQTDPRNFTRQTAEMFTRLVPFTDRVAFLKFANSPQILRPLGPFGSEKGKLEAVRLLDQLKRNGQTTDIEKALDAGLMLFPFQGASPRALVLLTDGRIDLDDHPSEETEPERSSRERILTEIVSRSQELRVPIYAISFGGETDETLLADLAQRTGGLYFKIASDTEMAKVYFSIFNQIQAPQMAQVKGGEFRIDREIKEATLVIEGEGVGGRVALVNPIGEISTPAKPGPAVRWGGGEAYWMATIPKPKPGLWRLQGLPRGGPKVVLMTDVQLELGTIRTSYAGDEPIFVLARLRGQSNRTPLKITYNADLFSEDGQLVATTLLEDDGSSSGQCEVDGRADRVLGGWAAGRFILSAPLPPGLYTLQVRVNAPTFERQRETTMRVTEGTWATLARETVELKGGEPLTFDFDLAHDPAEIGLAERVRDSTTLPGHIPPPLLTVGSPSGGTEELVLGHLGGRRWQAVWPRLPEAGAYALTLRLISGAASPVCLKLERTFQLAVATSSASGETFGPEPFPRTMEIILLSIIGALVVVIFFLAFLLLRRPKESAPEADFVADLVSPKPSAAVAAPKVEKPSRPALKDESRKEEPRPSRQESATPKSPLAPSFENKVSFTGPASEIAVEEILAVKPKPKAEEPSPAAGAKPKVEEPAPVSASQRFKPAAAEKPVTVMKAPEPEPEEDPLAALQADPDLMSEIGEALKLVPNLPQPPPMEAAAGPTSRAAQLFGNADGAPVKMEAELESEQAQAALKQINLDDIDSLIDRLESAYQPPPDAEPAPEPVKTGAARAPREKPPESPATRKETPDGESAEADDPKVEAEEIEDVIKMMERLAQTRAKTLVAFGPQYQKKPEEEEA